MGFSLIFKWSFYLDQDRPQTCTKNFDQLTAYIFLTHIGPLPKNPPWRRIGRVPPKAPPVAMASGTTPTVPSVAVASGTTSTAEAAPPVAVASGTTSTAEAVPVYPPKAPAVSQLGSRVKAKAPPPVPPSESVDAASGIYPIIPGESSRQRQFRLFGIWRGRAGRNADYWTDWHRSKRSRRDG